MPPSPKYTQQPWAETYSEIIDVRSQLNSPKIAFPTRLICQCWMMLNALR
jgi:hypothetical protein